MTNGIQVVNLVRLDFFDATSCIAGIAQIDLVQLRLAYAQVLIDVNNSLGATPLVFE